MREIWKDIEGFENYYQVSNLGRVKSLERIYENKGCNGGFYHRKEKILKPAFDKDHYLKITLCKNKKKYNKTIHRLVAEAFIPNPQKLPCINHKDENKSNNNVDNLEWCTFNYNNSYGTKGERTSKAKLKPLTQYDLNGNVIKRWSSLKAASTTLKLNFRTISKCCLNQRKTAFGYVWKYETQKEGKKDE